MIESHCSKISALSTSNSGSSLIPPHHQISPLCNFFDPNSYVKVKGKASPFDGDWLYWSTRKGNYPEVSKRVATPLKM